MNKEEEEQLNKLQSAIVNIDWEEFEFKSNLPEDVDDARGDFIRAADKLQEIIHKYIKFKE